MACFVWGVCMHLRGSRVQIVLPFDASSKGFHVGVVAVMAQKKKTGEGEFMRKLIGLTEPIDARLNKIRVREIFLLGDLSVGQYCLCKEFCGIQLRYCFSWFDTRACTPPLMHST